jgi:hypothetical protein
MENLQFNFDSIEVRRVANGYVIQVNGEDDTKEYVYDTSRKTLKFVKTFLEHSKAQVTD